jgi:hypothetical protein
MKAIDIALESFKHREKYILNYEKLPKKLKELPLNFLKIRMLKLLFLVV